MTRHLLIGSGIAALSAAEAIRATDPSAAIVLVSEEGEPYYSRPGLAYLLAGRLPERQLHVRSSRGLHTLRLERVLGRVTAVAPASRQVSLADGRRLPYDRLLIATGAASIRPDFPGGNLPGVVRLDSLADTRGILKLARRGRTAVVIGGGSTALELVEGLHARGMRTHYLLRGDRYWPRVLDPSESALVESRLLDTGVQLHHRTEVAVALAGPGRVHAVETRTGQRIHCDLLAVATGVRPRLQLARDAGLRLDRGVLVDEFLETSAPGVFAAGDVAQTYDPRVGRSVLDTLWSAAEGQGWAAGLNMAGARTAYRKPVARNVTCLAGVVTTVVGDVGGEDDLDLVAITRGQSEAWSGAPARSTVAHRGPVDRIRLRLAARTAVGAVIMGDQSLTETLTALIAAGTDLSPILPALWERPDSLWSLLGSFPPARSNVRDLVAR
jgi:3-phenylpropionate/trans-cinnamate dioxygenase ferredoxin reductase component